MNLRKKYADISENVKEYVELHIGEKIFVRDMARSMGLHPGYLNTSFKEITGMSISRYIRERKIKEATELLAESENSLADIWTFLGYCDQSHFHKHFKQVTGITPNQYRMRFINNF